MVLSSRVRHLSRAPTAPANAGGLPGAERTAGASFRRRRPAFSQAPSGSSGIRHPDDLRVARLLPHPRSPSVSAGTQTEDVDLSAIISRDDVAAVRRTVCTVELAREADEHILGARGDHLQEEKIRS